MGLDRQAVSQSTEVKPKGSQIHESESKRTLCYVKTTVKGDPIQHTTETRQSKATQSARTPLSVVARLANRVVITTLYCASKPNKLTTTHTIYERTV